MAAMMETNGRHEACIGVPAEIDPESPPKATERAPGAAPRGPRRALLPALWAAAAVAVSLFFALRNISAGIPGLFSSRGGGKADGWFLLAQDKVEYATDAAERRLIRRGLESLLAAVDAADASERAREAMASAASPLTPFKDKFLVPMYRSYWGDYVGDLDSEGRRHGRGVMTWDDGDTYDGEWKDGRTEGSGVHRKASGTVCEGEWKGMLNMEGQGKCQYPNGDMYEGGFHKNKYNGQGKFRYADGMVYEGKIHNGVWEAGVNVYK